MITIYDHIIHEIKDKLCVDVGANIGCITKLLTDHYAKVIAIEPIKKLTNHENFKKAYKILNTCISDHIGEIQFYESNYTGLSSCRQDWKFIAKQGYKAQWKLKTLPCITLDSLIKDENQIPFFIKIDVEGYEYKCLKGLNHIPEYLLIEYTKSDIQINELTEIIYNKFKNIENIWYTCGFKKNNKKYLNFYETNSMNNLIKQIHEFDNDIQGDILIKNNTES